MAIVCVHGWENGLRFSEEGMKVPGFLYADDYLVLCGESEEDLSDESTFY